MDYLYAFLAGGAICAVCQIFIDRTKLTPARILTFLVVLGVLLSGAGLYEPFVRFAGCGASVPLTGFGHVLASGVREAVDSEGALGILTGGLRAASGGIAGAMVFALLATVLFRSKPKK